MKLGSFVVTAAATALVAGSASAGTVVTALHDSLNAAPQHYFGRCPGMIVFQGTIIVRGDFQPGRPAEIGYQFSRSDGAMSQNRYISVPGPGVYHITETWTLGGAQVPHYQGWERFKAWPTANVQNHTGDTWSNQAHFTLACARVR